MYKLNINYLGKEDLEYEVKIRGIEPSGTVDSLRKCLRSLLVLERSGNPVRSCFELDNGEEILECESKLNELKNQISTFSGTAKQTLKIESKFAHVVGRINRISEESEFREKRSKLLIEMTSLLSEYESKTKLLISSNVSEPPLNPDFADNSGVNVSNLANSTMAGGQNSPPNATPFNVNNFQHPATNTANCSSVPVYKWGIKFSGNTGLSFNAFLQRVEELCISRRVNKTELFHSASDLFDSHALNYYHLICKYANDWDALIKLMRDEFLPANFGDKLWKQILNRTQGSDEPIGIYVAAMTQLFDRMPAMVSDSLRLKVLRANTLPFYQERLSLYEVNTPFELIELCRKLEETRLRVEEFKPPRKGNVSLEPDLDYEPLKRDFSKPSVSNVTSEVHFSESDSLSQNPNTISKRHINKNYCNRNNHQRYGFQNSHNNNGHGDNCQNNNFRNNSYNSQNHNSFRYQPNTNSSHTYFRENNNNLENNQTRLGNYQNNSRNQHFANHNHCNNSNGDNCNNQNNSNDNFRQNGNNSYNIERNSRINNQNSNGNFQNKIKNQVVQLCYKCNQPNHFAKNCTTYDKKCFTCGKVNYTKRTCPSCNKSSQSPNQGNGLRSQS